MSSNGLRLPRIALSSQDTQQIMTALSNLAPGQRLIYHQGRLAADRKNTYRYDIYQRRNIGSVANFAYKLAMNERRIDLVQSKTEAGYDYVAIGRVDHHRPSLFN